MRLGGLHPQRPSVPHKASCRAPRSPQSRADDPKTRWTPGVEHVSCTSLERWCARGTVRHRGSVIARFKRSGNVSYVGMLVGLGWLIACYSERPAELPRSGKAGAPASAPDSAPAPAAAGSSSKRMCLRQPQLHRAADGCDDVREAGEVATPELYQPLCQSDADCVEGRNGRCKYYASYWGTRGKMSLRCTYDACIADADCPKGSICYCNGAGDANICVPAKCRTDADCPEPSYCSPSTRFVGSVQDTQFVCRTCDDECVDDRNCGADQGHREQACLYLPELRHWGCMFAMSGME